jgi:hypothetical protein
MFTTIVAKGERRLALFALPNIIGGKLTKEMTR